MNLNCTHTFQYLFPTLVHAGKNGQITHTCPPICIASKSQIHRIPLVSALWTVQECKKLSEIIVRMLWKLRSLNISTLYCTTKGAHTKLHPQYCFQGVVYVTIAAVFQNAKYINKYKMNNSIRYMTLAYLACIVYSDIGSRKLSTGELKVFMFTLTLV